MSKLFQTWGAVAFLSFLTMACAPTDTSMPPSAETNDLSVGVLGGEPVQEEDVVMSTTVGLYDAKSRSTCTGSLIAEDMVLTAAHCVDLKSKSLFVVFSKDFYVNGKLNKSKMVTATSFLLHSQYDSDQSRKEDTFDLAIVRFKGELPANYRIASLSPNVETVLENSELIAVGYGLSNGFFQTGSGVLRKAKLQFRQLFGKTELSTHQKEQGVCSGDSGGPLYQKIDGQLIQVGVASRVATKFLSCRDYAVYTRVDVYKGWIAETMEKLRAQ